MANEARFEVYPRRGERELGCPDEFGWRFRAANGQITAVAGEGFAVQGEAKRAARDFAATILSGFGAARVDVPWDGPSLIYVDE